MAAPEKQILINTTQQLTQSQKQTMKHVKPITIIALLSLAVITLVLQPQQGVSQPTPPRAAAAGNVKWTLTVSPSTETVPAGSNCKFYMTPTGPKSLTGVRVQIFGDISPKTAQTPDLSQRYTTIGINLGSIGLFCTTGHGSKGTYTISATATGIQYPINGETQTASATLIVD